MDPTSRHSTTLSSLSLATLPPSRLWYLSHQIRHLSDTGILSTPVLSSNIGCVAMYSVIVACHICAYYRIGHIPMASIAYSDGVHSQTSPRKFQAVLPMGLLSI